ncbi:MAG TPA: hypothetical protein VK918_00860 [Pyrinomonadaceae bacterium]|nr:hypothetical protein [Pyrinomonadaceae bacterium]
MKAASEPRKPGYDLDREGQYFEEQLTLIRRLAVAYNRRELDDLHLFLAEDVEYHSQLTQDPVIGKEAVLAHIQERFDISKQGVQDVYAEIGFCQSEWGSVRLFGYDGQPCMLLSTCYGCTPIGLFTVDSQSALITSIEVWVSILDPEKAERTGEYPE